jgi:hypothetical protein
MADLMITAAVTNTYVKLSLCLVLDHGMKMYEGVEVQPHILEQNGCERSVIMFLPLQPYGKDTPLDRWPLVTYI